MPTPTAAGADNNNNAVRHVQAAAAPVCCEGSRAVFTSGRGRHVSELFRSERTAHCRRRRRLALPSPIFGRRIIAAAAAAAGAHDHSRRRCYIIIYLLFSLSTATDRGNYYLLLLFFFVYYFYFVSYRAVELGLFVFFSAFPPTTGLNPINGICFLLSPTYLFSFSIAIFSICVNKILK